MAGVLAIAVLVVAPAGAQRPAPFTVSATGKSFQRLADAVRSIGGGEGTIRIAPGRYRDCAVQAAGRVSYVAQVSGTAIFDGGICEGKATLVLGGRSARVEGLVFTHAKAADGNGAGIRLEKGDLIVSFSRFVDAQSGILSAIDPSGTISIDHSTFSGLGNHSDSDGVHSLYVGGYGALRITNSRFERGTSGHYVKSRAARIELVDNSFDDSRGSNTNYMVDLSNGAIGRIASNSFLQGNGKENYGTWIAIAAEGRVNPSAGLVIESNRAALVPAFRGPTSFIGDWSGERLIIRDNRLAPGIALFRRH